MNIEGLNEFSTALIVAAIAWFVPKLIEVATSLWAEFRYNKPNVSAVIEHAAEKGVRLAEQTGFLNGVKRAGSEKLKIAVDFALQWLKETSKLEPSRDTVVGAVEAELNQLFPKAK